MSSRNDQLIRLIDPVCTSAGFELVDVRLQMDQGGWVLRVFVDRANAEGEVDLNDCERLSRELSALLDVEDPIPQAYTLEVSSPGIERPLRTAAHFERHLGDEVRVAMAVPVSTATGDRRNFKGPIKAVDGDHVVITVDGKHDFRLALRDIDNARLVPDWEAVMQKQPPKKSRARN